MPWSKEQVSQWVANTLAANNDGEEKAIKIIVSGGVSNSLLPDGNSTIAILVDPRTLCPAEWYEKGVGVITVKHNRYTPEAKTNNYIEAVKQTQLGKKINAIEPVYYNDTQVFESSNSNIFAVIDGKLLTPATNILAGITRSVLLETLRLDTPLEIRDFTHEELMSAEEVFLTGSNKEIIPITQIDGKPVGAGNVGEVTKVVMKQFRDFTLSDKW
jgi:branched-subunit amino acid aminotransferase/4-amino-4-deoxychorismate lyase